MPVVKPCNRSLMFSSCQGFALHHEEKYYFRENARQPVPDSKSFLELGKENLGYKSIAIVEGSWRGQVLASSKMGQFERTSFFHDLVSSLLILVLDERPQVTQRHLLVSSHELKPAPQHSLVSA